MTLRPLGLLGKFYIYAFIAFFIIPLFVMKSYLIKEAIDIALYNSVLFLILFSLSYSFSFTKNKNTKGHNSQYILYEKVSLFTIILFVLIAIIVSGIIGIKSGMFGARGENIISNVQTSEFAFINGLLSPLFNMISAYFWALALKKNSKLFFLYAALFSGYILGSTGTRWYFLISISPLIIYAIVQLKAFKSVLVSVIFFLSFLPFSFIRNNEEYSLELIFLRMPMELPIFESVRAIDLIGIHKEGIMAFVHGIIYYPIPRFLFDKGFDETMLDFNWAVLGIDIRYYPATILPGLIGSLYMYGGPLMIGLFGLIFGRAFRYLDGKLFSLMDYGASGFTYASLLFISLFLQVRNLSVGYFVSFIIFSFIWYSSKKGWIVLPKKKKSKNHYKFEGR